MSNYAVEKRNAFENKMQKFTTHRKKVALFIFIFSLQTCTCRN